jgi:DNA repair protein RadA/Sms
MEGTRPLLVEVQALATPTSFGLPRRSANGLDTSRLQLLVAVLQQRVGLGLGTHDVYANVVGGLRIREPAVDLAVAVAIASSVRDLPVDRQAALIGEIGLSSELRSVNQLDRRINEAARLGFTRVMIPKVGGPTIDRLRAIEIVRCSNVSEAIEAAVS